jgi:MFS family permease
VPDDSERLGVWSVFRANRDLRRLVLALAGSTLGYWGYTVAVLVYAFEQGGTRLVGVAAFARLFPAAVASPVAGAIADRYPRERVMVVGDLLRMTTTAAACVVIAFGGPAVVVLTLVAVNAALYSSFRPAMRALTPALSRAPDELAAANIMASTVDSVGMLAGPALGGVLLALSGPAAAFGACSLSLAWSATLVAPIRVARERAPPASVRSASLTSLIAEGPRMLANDSSVRLIMLLTAGQTISYGALSVLTVVMVEDLLHVGQGWVGYLNAALGLGGLIGAVAVAPVVVRRLSNAAITGLTFWGLPLIAIGLWPRAGLAIAAITVTGVANTLVDVSLNTLLQRSAREEVLGRVFALLGMVTTATIALAGLVTPAVVAAVGARGALVAIGLLLPLLVLATAGRLRALDRSTREPMAELALLRGVSLLASLPPVVLERLARRAVPVHAPAGATIVVQGEPGDQFFAIARGELDVTVDGRFVRRLGAGDSFGEIALLHEVPRTATVRALSDAELLALESDDFIPAMTQVFGSTAAAADGVLGGSLALVLPREMLLKPSTLGS